MQQQIFFCWTEMTNSSTSSTNLICWLMNSRASDVEYPAVLRKESILGARQPNIN